MNSFDINYLMVSIFTAIFGVFGIYHFVSYLILRHKILCHYCIIIFGLTLHWSWSLFPEGYLPEVIQKNGSLISAMTTTFGFLLFTTNYLNIHRGNHPKISRSYTFLKYTTVLIPILFVLNILTLHIPWLHSSLVMSAAITALLSVLLNIFSGIRLFNEEKFNKYYLYAYSPMLLSSVIYISAWFLKDAYTVDKHFIVLITSILITLQLILFSILIGYKFKSIEDENIRTQVETNKILALEVDKQTKDLQIAKKDLESKNHELESVNSLKNKLFSLLTHDVRGPLHNIALLVNLLENQIEDNELKEISQSLKNELDDRIAMVSALLDWSYNQLEGIKLNKKDCDIQEIFTSIAKQYERSAKEKDVKLLFEIETPTLFIDENMFKVVLRNLISNAIKFSTKNQNVILSSKKCPDGIEIGVQDFGVGMTTSWHKNLVKDCIPKTTLGTKGEQGTGFGLLITKDFVEMNGGELFCTSKPNEGTHFVMRFAVSNS
ncbi:ATP-binding protein [Dokdonia sp. Asnod1-B02]|uniref:sensor histidine kinase n=1 Tax=Dokdonia sp. Asnod1-B02 TaxID=3160573 RepID=UPI003868DD33